MSLMNKWKSKFPSVISRIKSLIKKKPIRWIFIVLIFLVLVGLAIPQLITLTCQTRAGSLLDGINQQGINDDKDRFACLLPILFDLQDDNEADIEKAIELLETSLKITPKYAHTYFLMGQAFCMKGEFESAIEYFDLFNQRRSSNPLGLMEKGFAYFSWAESLDQNQEDKKASYINSAILSLEEAGIRGALLKGHGDIAFNEGDYRTAWVYFRLSDAFNLMPDVYHFRMGVFDLVITDQTEEWDFLDEELILTLQDSLNIPPSAFFRLDDGALVYTRKVKGEEAGMFYRNKDPGGILIWAEDSGDYIMTVKALDHPPATTRIQVSLDLDPLLLIELPNGDENWIGFSEKITLEQGYHLLHIRLVNDDKVKGIDRNAYVGVFKLTLCE